MAKSSEEKEKSQSVESGEESKEVSNNGEMTQQEVDKLEAVRDLLFGQNVREYRDEFKELKDLLKAHRDEIDQSANDFKTDILNKIESLDNKFTEKIEKTSKAINERLEMLSNDKTDRKQLANLLSEMAKQLDS